MEYLALIGAVTLIHLLGVISPGPDFIVAVRQSLVYSRRIGMWTALGFGLGIAVHVFYSLAGVAVLISQSILAFNIIKYLGALYLVYLGVKAFLSKSDNAAVAIESKAPEPMSALSAIRTGFLTNVLNPKATLFFLSLFTVVIDPATPLPILLLISAIVVINTILWFSLVSVFFTQSRIRSAYMRFQGVFNRVLGGLLVALGIKVALLQK